MNKPISKQEFLTRQPSFPEVEESDMYYYEEANRLYGLGCSTPLGASLPAPVMRRMTLCLTGYIQDISCDAGIWRSFVDANRHISGRPVPFYDDGEDYVDYELNRSDVRWLTWYSLAMNYDPLRDICPHSPQILELADKWFGHIESIYEDMPVPSGYNLARGLDFFDKEDSGQIYQLGQWLFLHCYLMTPAFSLTLESLVSEFDSKNPDYDVRVREMLDEAMMTEPTGPLAYRIPEWLYLIVAGKMPAEPADQGSDIHKYYKAFTDATGGRTIAYFDTYRALNGFLTDKLGWQKGEEHLQQLKGESYFVLMVNKHKGMLVARDVARCIADPRNPYYDKEYARKHAFEMLTVRGRCPGDLLRRIFAEGWLPDARFPESECGDTALAVDNADFIARCYLQKYYTGD